MEVRKFRVKPVEVEAVLFVGPADYPDNFGITIGETTSTVLTSVGNQTVEIGDFIVKSPEAIFAIRSEIFLKYYEEI